MDDPETVLPPSWQVKQIAADYKHLLQEVKDPDRVVSLLTLIHPLR